MNEILKQYNNFSETYTDNFEIQDEIGNKRFYQFLSSVDLEGKQILDIGCGDGSDLVNFEKWEPSQLELTRQKSLLILEKKSFLI